MPRLVDFECIKKLEAEIRARLPHSYVTRMLNNNGGMRISDVDEWEMAKIRDDSSIDSIKKTTYDVRECTDGALKWKYFPRNGVAIADNGLGDVMFFHINGSDIGPELYVYLHETGSSVKLADDFSDYGKDD